MSTTRILPAIGAPVSSPAFDPSAVQNTSIGELVYGATLFTTELARRMADPTTAHEFAPFLVDPRRGLVRFQTHRGHRPM